MKPRGDAGVIFSDKAGTGNILRACWPNLATSLVSDLPFGAQLSPRLWSELVFQ